MTMYLHRDYEETIDYDFETNTYKIIPYNKKFDSLTLGDADILNGRLVAFVLYNKILYLVTDKVQIPIDDIKLDLKSKDIDEEILERKLIIKKGSKVVDTVEYTINKRIITEQVMYSEMSEVEDWDFGLLVINRFNDKTKLKRYIYIVNNGNSTIGLTD